MIEVLTSGSFVSGIMFSLAVIIIAILSVELREKRRWDKNQSVFKDPIPYKERHMYKRVIPKSIIKVK